MKALVFRLLESTVLSTFKPLLSKYATRTPAARAAPGPGNYGGGDGGGSGDEGGGPKAGGDEPRQSDEMGGGGGAVSAYNPEDYADLEVRRCAS